jgi:predicted O-methyltransferase YrrM
VDNVLWDGRVADPAFQDQDTVVRQTTGACATCPVLYMQLACDGVWLCVRL